MNRAAKNDYIAQKPIALKSALYIGLLGLLLLQSGGLLLLFQGRQQLIRMEVRQKLKLGSTRTEILCLSRSEFMENRVGNDELSLGGQMYDIRSVHFEGNEAHIEAFRDVEEENVLHTIRKMLHIDKKNRPIQPQVWHKWLALTFVMPEALHVTPVLYQTLPYADVWSRMGLVFGEIPVPPPRQKLC